MAKRLTYEEVKEHIESFGYKLLSNEYVNNSTKLLLECPFGHKYKTTFDIFKRGCRCPYCSNRAKHTYEGIKEYIESFGYKLLSEGYKNNHTKLKIKCSKGHEYETTFKDFKRGGRCAKCKGLKRYTIEEVREYIEENNYKLISEEYINEKEKMRFVCDKGHEYNASFECFKRGQRCPICRISKGERKIMDWLENYKIFYIYDSEYFEDLLSARGNPLRPDFIIEDKKIWIEYDGEFHFGERFEGDSFEIMQEHDKLKNEYAKRNNWKLIRIPYWEFDNIEKILEKEIKNNI